jgi:uncharacterized protein (TIGR03000 family)
MLVVRSVALGALILAAGSVCAAPPGFVSPPSYYHYPSARDTISPASRSLSNYFAPPQSYYLRPYNAESGSTRQYPEPPMTRSPQEAAGLDYPLLPRALREAEPPPRVTAEIRVRVPEGAELWFNGAKTQQDGAVRRFESPPLEPGMRYAYNVKARWTEGGKEVEKTLHVPVTAGARTTVEFKN